MDTAAVTPINADLWTEYRSVLSRQRMTPRASEWHEKRARHFVWNRDRSALAALSADDVCGYFRRTYAKYAPQSSLPAES